MPKKPRVRTLMDSQHVKGSERLLKSAHQYFCHIFWSLSKEISCKPSVLVVSEILPLCVNILTQDEKYSLSVKAIVWWNRFKCNYLETEKKILNFSLHFQNLHNVWNTLKKDDPQRLFFSENIDCKTLGYLNVEKAPCQNTYGQSTR